jgi:hypothetical protein
MPEIPDEGEKPSALSLLPAELFVVARRDGDLFLLSSTGPLLVEPQRLDVLGWQPVGLGGSYDAPGKILSQTYPICLMSADGGQR